MLVSHVDSVDRILRTLTALIIAQLLVGVECLLLSSSVFLRRDVPARVQEKHPIMLQSRSQPRAFCTPGAVNGIRHYRVAKVYEPGHRPSQALHSNRGDNLAENENDKRRTNIGSVVDYVGLACQPVVWVSLYSVATTGGGLPAGPGGCIGAVEGLSYLIVLVLALLPTSTTTTISGTREKTGDIKDASFLISVNTLSRITIGLGLVILAGLAADRGCVPNAKPILDYSAYLPVCSNEF